MEPGINSKMGKWLEKQSGPSLGSWVSAADDLSVLNNTLKRMNRHE